jgi:NarL family two-component system response regulator LiaR
MGRHISPAAAQPVVPPQFAPARWRRMIKTLRLSPQQANVVALVMKGRRDKQIAADLALSPSTVRTHLRGIFTRMDVQDRVELVLRVFAASKRPPTKTAILETE